VTEVGPGILRMQLPIRMPGLGHVNCYALLDGRGAALVDPGLPGPESWSALLDRLDQAGLRPTDVHTVVITHSHPDHFGLSPWLRDESDPEILAHEAFPRWLSDAPGPDVVDLVDVDPNDVTVDTPFDQATPWGTIWVRPSDAPPLEEFRRPSPTRWVRNDDVLRLAGRDWFVLHTPGHTLDHVCFHDPEEGILLSGDHVLPSITPHISGLGAGRDPLLAFEESLDRIGGVAGVRRVLPAHGHPFSDLAGRAAAIRAHHEERLNHLRDISAELGPASVIELSRRLFRPDHWGGMAEAETYAHVEHLRIEGLAVRYEKDGVLVYELAPRSH